MTAPLPASFAAALQRLQAWQQATGQTDPPAGHIAADGYRLGAWIAQQRSRRRRGLLAPARVQALTDAGITWDFTQPRTAPDTARRWQAALDAVAGFIDDHRRMPTTGDCADINLGDWLCRQREALAAGRLTPEQTAALDALALPWRTTDPQRSGRWQPDEQAFDTRLADLASYALATGSADVAQAHRTADGFALGQWLADQRWYRRTGRLASHREQALTALGVTWDPGRTRRPTNA